MKPSTRISGALFIVVASLVLAAMACYSDQIPGLFELTPYYTPTPMPTPAQSRLSVGDYALVPQELGRAFFSLTVYPEPLASNLLNSKALCDGGSTARVLYAAQGEDSNVYYLINCVGSVGWAAENRLAGPLRFERNDLGLTIAPPGEQRVTMLDEFTLQPAPIFLQQCMAGTIVSILDIKVADQDGDGVKELYYQVECPRGTRGYLDEAQLLGPLEINVGDRALAVIGATDDDEVYRLASEPGPITPETAVEGNCIEGAILVAEEARVVDGEVYYRLTCGDISGWASSDRFIGPFRYDTGQRVLISVQPIATFNTEPEPSEDEFEEVAPAPAAREPEVIYTVPPAFLTTGPGPAVFETEETESNVVGVCPTRSVATISQYAGFDGVIYYQVTCQGCMADEVQTEQQTISVGNATSTGIVSICPQTQELTGWVDQETLRGPLPFVPGDSVRIKDSSYTLETTEEGQTFVRLPTTTSGAFALTPTSQHVEFAGRCPVDAEFVITDFAIEQARTGTGLNFYFKLECTGQPASYTRTDQGGRTSTATVRYDETASETITGWVLARDLELAGS